MILQIREFEGEGIKQASKEARVNLMHMFFSTPKMFL
jgi:hypothetical protein